MQMIAMRLRITEGYIMPLPHMSAYVNDKVAIVFVVNKDNKPLAIEDDVNLFPSDALITQLRLLIA